MRKIICISIKFLKFIYMIYDFQMIHDLRADLLIYCFYPVTYDSFSDLIDLMTQLCTRFEIVSGPSDPGYRQLAIDILCLASLRQQQYKHAGQFNCVYIILLYYTQLNIESCSYYVLFCVIILLTHMIQCPLID